MSSQRGNSSRSRSQKHKNTTTFKNNMHDTSGKTKLINSLQMPDTLCAKCSDVIEWKIKFKKYKPLTVAKKCVRCEQKSIKSAYHILCQQCAESSKVCAKCGLPHESEKPIPNTTDDMDLCGLSPDELKLKLKPLSERQRRTVLRCLKKDPSDSKIKALLQKSKTEADDLDDFFDGLSEGSEDEASDLDLDDLEIL